eukprot:scaffold6371_cov110-Isochrysis_galbana.AAC.6
MLGSGGRSSLNMRTDPSTITHWTAGMAVLDGECFRLESEWRVVWRCVCFVSRECALPAEHKSA